MGEHTPEPWFVGNGVEPLFAWNGQIVAIVDGLPRIIVSCNQNFVEEAIANARRIVACVNACQGLSTEEVEKRNFWTDDAVTTNNNLILTRERDEARAMVKELAEALRGQHWTVVHDEIVARHGHKDDEYEIHERDHPNCPHCALLIKAEALR